ncbi:Uncharacterized protein involved in exopolysaccharide biosynthesis [Balnearium lithotrophicum]|uniref:Uncharacterized protein involved in exopolysaccharide biosynthesis n=1 Tax=Balnearium lithotrophicum TaxID=223788 RepID=A0A521BP68_9BACT|nr:Wzz/FepE/Etk N-terminal domain-containing protein [Balnearium lithotrophicum]SMO48926.1 Uncharacterized protein involved in exopolysaccharide biosynthesis [Balnearium lithotrophicum]
MEKTKETYSPYYEEDEIDLYELWLTLKKRKKIVLGFTVFFTLIALILCFILPPTYKTETTLMPLGGKKGGGLSSLLASLPISVSLPTSQSGLTVEAVLNSRTLRERVIRDLNLLPLLFPDKWDSKRRKWILKGKDDRPPTILDGAEKLKKLISVSTNKKTGVVTLSVEFKENPQIAYEIARTALKEADNILNEKSFTLAKKYKIYVGKQLQIARRKLLEIEKIYEEFIEGKIKKVPFIFGEDVFKAPNVSLNDERIKNLERELKNLREKVKNLQKNTNYVSLPEYQVNFQKLQAQMDIAKELFETLVKEYEMAKAQEMKEQISFQVIDPPYVPEIDKPYKPKKKLIVAVAFISGLFLGIFAAFFKEWLDGVKERHREEEQNA